MLSRRVALSMLLYALLGCVSRVACAQELTPEEVYKQAAPATMTLTVRTKSKESRIGTAFMGIKEGFAITAWHVVRDAEQVTAKFPDGEEFEVSGLIDKDEKRDVALIRVKVFGRPLLPLATKAPEVGAKAYVIGAPKGLEFSLSDGLVSQVRQMDGAKNIQFTCAASPGNSGGPLVNSKGEAIGIVSWQNAEGQNLNFAIPVTYALALDATLPTQAWESLKTATTASSGDKTQTDADNFDRALAQVVVDTCDLTVVKEQLFAQTHRDGGYNKGLPVTFYSVTDTVQKHALQLSDLTPPDASRERQRKAILEDAANVMECAQTLAKTILAAKKTDGYYTQADELYKMSLALDARKVEPLAAEDLKALRDSIVFVSTLPKDIQVQGGYASTLAIFDLGVSCFSKAPTQVVLVDKNSIADKMGIKPLDTLLRADITFYTLDAVKTFLISNKGKKVKITILRDGKERQLEYKVPSDLM